MCWVQRVQTWTFLALTFQGPGASTVRRRAGIVCAHGLFGVGVGIWVEVALKGL